MGAWIDIQLHSTEGGLDRHGSLLLTLAECSKLSITTQAAGVDPWTGLLPRQNLRLRPPQLLPPRLHRWRVRDLPRQFQKHPVVLQILVKKLVVESRQFRVGAGGGEHRE